MQRSEKLEFAHGGQAGYFVVTRELRDDTTDVIGLIKVSAPLGTLALKKKDPDARLGAQVLWQRLWQPSVIQQAATNMLEAAKEKEGAEAHSVDFVGAINSGRLVVQRNAAGIRFVEQFDAGMGIEFTLPVKTAKKLANLIIGIEVPVAELDAEAVA